MESGPTQYACYETTYCTKALSSSHIVFLTECGDNKTGDDDVNVNCVLWIIKRNNPGENVSNVSCDDDRPGRRTEARLTRLMVIDDGSIMDTPNEKLSW